MSARFLICSLSKRLSFCKLALSTCAFGKPKIPARYNFVRDHMEVLAAEEQVTGKKLAYWWVDNAGNEVRYSYSDIVEQSKILANGLLNHGLQPGDRILLLLPRVPEWWLLLLACFRCGVVPIPATIMLSQHDIIYRLEAAKPKMVFTIPEIAPKIDAAISRIPFHCVKVICPQATSPQSSTTSSWVKFQDLVKNASSTHTCIDSAVDDSMMCYFTSGTTGLPKMVDLTHGFALGHKYSTAKFIGSKPGHVTWIYADPGWVATLYGAVFPPWFQRNTVFSYYTPPSAPVWSRILEVFKKFPVNVFLTPPTVYRMLLQERHLPKREELPHLLDCLSGGEPLNAETFLEWKKKMGYEIREIYGQTETPGLIGNMPGSKVKPGSFGKPLGFDMRIVDDNLKEVETDEEGQIAVKYGEMRPLLFKQYIGAPESTKKAFRGGYYLTGDKGRRDSDGYLFFTSRTDDVIISSGYRIGPFEVESATLKHPAVLESAAVSSPHKKRGEVVKSFIVLKAEYKTADKALLACEIQETVKRTTAPYKYPRRIEFVEELPKTISGKIKRADLRAKEWAGWQK